MFMPITPSPPSLHTYTHTHQDSKHSNDEDLTDEKEDEEREEIMDDDKEWKELQESVKRDRDTQTGEASDSPIVHAPFYPKVTQDTLYHVVALY